MCPCCEKEKPDDMVMYLINSAGGYGLPEMWACADCLRDAEDGSKLAKLRDGIYADDFAEGSFW